MTVAWFQVYFRIYSEIFKITRQQNFLSNVSTQLFAYKTIFQYKFVKIYSMITYIQSVPKCSGIQLFNIQWYIFVKDAKL